MCGRYVNPATAEAERYFAVHLIRWKFDRSYNVAPTQQVPVGKHAAGFLGHPSALAWLSGAE